MAEEPQKLSSSASQQPSSSDKKPEDSGIKPQVCDLLSNCWFASFHFDSSNNSCVWSWIDSRFQFRFPESRSSSNVSTRYCSRVRWTNEPRSWDLCGSCASSSIWSSSLQLSYPSHLQSSHVKYLPFYIFFFFSFRMKIPFYIHWLSGLALRISTSWWPPLNPKPLFRSNHLYR